MAQNKIQTEVKRIIANKTQFYQILNDKVTHEAQQKLEMQAMRDAAIHNAAANEADNSYLSKRYAEFYKLML